MAKDTFGIIKFSELYAREKVGCINMIQNIKKLKLQNNNFLKFLNIKYYIYKDKGVNLTFFTFLFFSIREYKKGSL